MQCDVTIRTLWLWYVTVIVQIFFSWRLVYWGGGGAGVLLTIFDVLPHIHQMLFSMQYILYIYFFFLWGGGGVCIRYPHHMKLVNKLMAFEILTIHVVLYNVNFELCTIVGVQNEVSVGHVCIACTVGGHRYSSFCFVGQIKER